MTQVLGLCLTTSGLRQNNDRPWVQGGRPRGRGLSAVLLHQGRLLGQSLPVLHHHPEPARPLLIEGLPFEQIRYDLADTGFEVHEEATADWNKVFGLPLEWPGPDDCFEGIHTDAPILAPRLWLPTATDQLGKAPCRESGGEHV